MEKYVAPEMEVVEFEAEDVITTSSNPNCPSLDETEIKFGTGYPN